MSKVSLASIKDNIEKSVEEVFVAFDGLPALLRGRTKAYVKVNAIDARPETYTSPAALEAQLAEIEGPLFLAGKCAIEETHNYFSTKMSAKQIFMSPSCNDLASTSKALTKLMKVNPLSLAYASPLKSLALLLVARLKGSKAKVAL